MLESGEDYHDIPSLVEAKAKKNGEKIALVSKGRRLTYDQLLKDARRSAQGFANLGVKKGDKVAFFLYNSVDYVSAWYGLNMLGGVLVSLNTALKGEILQYELADSDSNVLIADTRLYPDFAAVQDRLDVKTVIAYDPTRRYEGLPASVRAFPDFLGDPSEIRDQPGPLPQDPASILYTSGTTGPPKGVVIAHEKYLSTAKAISARSQLHPGSVLFTALPLFHCNAQEMTTNTAILNDLTAAFEEWFSASAFWDSAGALNATHVSLLISMINVLYKQPEKPSDRTHSVRVALTAGTGKDIWRRFEERFNVKIIELYGMTECGCTTLMNPPEKIKVGSVGTPLEFVEAQVVDDNDVPLAAGVKGELVVRPKFPYTMMMEYYKKPDKTVEAWRNLWFHTGDYVFKDEDGYFYFVDRKKDVIRRRGENIAPYDVELVLNLHPKVFESVVVGVPSPLGEEDVKAYVRLKPGMAVQPTELFEFMATRLPFFMVPRFIEVLDEIPKTANQKAQRYVLRQRPIGDCWDREKLGVKLQRPAR